MKSETEVLLGLLLPQDSARMWLYPRTRQERSDRCLLSITSSM